MGQILGVWDRYGGGGVWGRYETDMGHIWRVWDAMDIFLVT